MHQSVRAVQLDVKWFSFQKHDSYKTQQTQMKVSSGWQRDLQLLCHLKQVWSCLFEQQQQLMWLMKRSTGREWTHFPTLKDILVVRLRKGETVSLPLAPGLTWLQNLTSNKSTVSTAKYTHTLTVSLSTHTSILSLCLKTIILKGLYSVNMNHFYDTNDHL